MVSVCARVYATSSGCNTLPVAERTGRVVLELEAEHPCGNDVRGGGRLTHPHGMDGRSAVGKLLHGLGYDDQ